MSLFKPGTKIGYLGGGQLARMLSESAANNGLIPYVYSSNNDDPAAQVSGQWVQGELTDTKKLVSFLKQVDVATFESEFLDAIRLKKAQSKTNTKIYPAPELMGQLQDRKSQKQLYDQYKLPTSPWAAVDSTEEINNFIADHDYPVVFKKRFFGYDGYGTFIVKNRGQLAAFMTKEFKADLFIVEKFIAFKKECAVILARSRNGDFTHLPFVESFQKDARCDWINGPVKIPGQEAMFRKLKNFLKKIDYVGAMGVEFFLNSKGLVINEIAPRVHNTGHYSLTTEGLSQFDLHNFCLLGVSLPKKIDIKNGFAMANLIGKGKTTQLSGIDGLYWYGKADNRKGRKMGHINALGKNPSAALKEALKKRKDFKL